jgi:hypothetical protein
VKPYRDIAVLAGMQVLCFSALTQLEPHFVIIHLYQSILYIAIFVMLYYQEDRWAYMIAMLASTVWLGLAYFSRILSTAGQKLLAYRSSDTSDILVELIAVGTALIAFLMIALCARHWKKEYVGLGKTISTLLVSLGIVAVYYGILLRWFWDMVPSA